MLKTRNIIRLKIAVVYVISDAQGDISMENQILTKVRKLNWVLQESATGAFSRCGIPIRPII